MFPVNQYLEKLEEFQLEKQRREAELGDKIAELVAQNADLTDRIDRYEEEVFELSEQVAQLETEDEGGMGMRTISRRLSTFMESTAAIKTQRTQGKSNTAVREHEDED